jgi:ribA/ribD-fused uncharacterized protein
VRPDLPNCTPPATAPSICAGGDRKKVRPGANLKVRVMATNRHIITFHEQHKRYAAFCNDAPYGVRLEDITWPTVTHYLLGKQYPAVNVADLRAAVSADDARVLVSQAPGSVRYSWEPNRDYYLEVALQAKFSQHLDLENLLLSTDEAHLVYLNRSDRYYGIGPSGAGHNMMGRILMRVRRSDSRRLLSTALDPEARRELFEYEEFARDQAGDADALTLLANEYFQAGMFERATATARMAIRLDPENEMAMRVLVRGLVKVHRYEEALPHAHRLVRMDREDWEYLLWLSDIYSFLGRTIAARTCHSRARRLREETE